MPEIIEILGTDKIKNSRQVINDNFLNLELRPFFAGVIEKPVITDNGDGSLTLSDFKAALFPSSDFEGVVSIFEITGGTIELINNMVNFIICDYNEGTPIIRKTIDQHEINESNIIPIWTAHRSGNDICKIDWNGLGIGLPNKIHKSIVKTERYRRESGLKIFGTGTRNIIVEEGKIWIGGVDIELLPIDTSDGDNIILFKHVSGAWQTESVTQFNNTQYDNGTDLVTLTNNRYAVNFLYRGVDDAKHLFMVLGQGDYKSTEVNSALPPRRDDLPEVIRYCSIPIGRVIVKKNSNDGVFLSAFDTSFPFTGILSHDDLLDIKLAGEDIDFGHISAGVQSIYGVKTFMETIVGNIDTADKLKTTRTINGVNFDGSENININLNNSLIPGTGISGESFDGSTEKTWNIDFDKVMDLDSEQTITAVKTFSETIVGNIDTADKLKTARKINGVDFDGSQDISITTVLAGSLTPGDGISGDVFDGSGNKTWNIDSNAVVMTTGDQTIAGIKTFVNGIKSKGIRISEANNQDNANNGIYCWPDDDFLYGNAGYENYINHYGLGFHTAYDGSQRNAYIAGHFGIDFFTGGKIRLRVDREGNVGIGGTPSHNFDILKSKSIGKLGTNNPLYLGSDSGSYVGFNCYRNASGNFVFGDNSSDDYASVLWFNKVNGQLDFYHSIITGNSGETMTLDGIFNIRNNYIYFLKNLGIGTSNPFGKLHVSNGNFLVTGTHGSSPALSVSGAGTRMFFYPRKSAFRAGYVSGTQWNDGNIGDYSVAMGYNTTASKIGSTATGDNTTASGNYSTAMGFYTTAAGDISTAMGFNTTAAGNYSLVSGYFMSDNGDNAFMWGRSGSPSTTDYNIKTWRNSDVGTKYGTLKGTWDINGGAITSDIRLKKNVKPIDSALDKINLINPVAFEWKRPEVRNELDTIGEYGVIAQELQKVFPELITHRPTEDPDLIKDGVQLGVKYTGLIAPMIKAIQELSAKIENIENNIIGGSNGN